MSSFSVYSQERQKFLYFRWNSEICRNDVLYQRPRWENEYEVFEDVGEEWSYLGKAFIPRRFRSKTAILKYYEAHN